LSIKKTTPALISIRHIKRGSRDSSIHGVGSSNTRLGRQLQLQHLKLSGELECSDTDTARQFTLYLSDIEEDLTTDESHSSTNKTYDVIDVKSSSILETPD
jgi:hypothetical protein